MYTCDETINDNNVSISFSRKNTLKNPAIFDTTQESLNYQLFYIFIEKEYFISAALLLIRDIQLSLFRAVNCCFSRKLFLSFLSKSFRYTRTLSIRSSYLTIFRNRLNKISRFRSDTPIRSPGFSAGSTYLRFFFSAPVSFAHGYRAV